MAGVSFQQSFVSYGEGENPIQQEVREDIKRAIITSLGSVAFSRTEGLGIESFENESFSSEFDVLLKYSIATALADYNLRSIPERQILFSQDTIILSRSRGELRISIYYALAYEISQGTSAQEAGDVITLPEGADGA